MNQTRLRKLREERIARETDSDMMAVVFPTAPDLSLEQKRASFTLSHCMAEVFALKEKQAPKTAIWNRLNQTEDCLGKALDFYRISKFRNPDLRKASRLFDLIKKELLFNILPTTKRKKQIRRQKRNSLRSKGA